MPVRQTRGNFVNVREPAVAGLFYPAAKSQLRQTVDRLLHHAALHSGVSPKALILPHAGYVYSGAAAAAACKLLQPLRTRIRRVALFGPAHRVYLDGMSVPSADAFRTPLGDVALDSKVITALATMPGVCVSELAHRDEHSLEVQLPFLQTVLQEFQLVPVVAGRAASTEVAAVIDAVWGGPETLIVVSSDLSHYLDYETARQVDAATCAAILARSTRLNGEQACGACAINGLMQARHSRGLAIENIALCNSGDTSGDKHRVVGYGAFALH